MKKEENNDLNKTDGKKQKPIPCCPDDTLGQGGHLSDAYREQSGSGYGGVFDSVQPPDDK